MRARLARLAWLLDSSIPIPGTPYTIGVDALIGLIPFIGDAVGVLLSSYILSEANRLGVSRSVLARMAFNVALDGLVGIIPFAGDVFDAAWKPNQRNVRLLNEWLERPHRAERSSRLFVAGLVVVLIVFCAVVAALTYLLVRWLVSVSR